VSGIQVCSLKINAPTNYYYHASVAEYVNWPGLVGFIGNRSLWLDHACAVRM